MIAPIRAAGDAKLGGGRAAAQVLHDQVAVVCPLVSASTRWFATTDAFTLISSEVLIC